ncbi:MAG: YggS family pyridoxal phosphate-dependent enzyme [Treponema sp.]|jgi:pyridoxal phosphate enzyme (YggS family)|nr:YggS family pyridoxal phosphate-dependent enzyme [Treponema sp.]
MGFDIAAAMERLEERITKACLRSGRKREEVSLMGVSKFIDLETVEEAAKQGLRLFGESRVQEGVKKFSAYRERHTDEEETQVHLIGSLQRNKAKAAADFFDCIQSVDRQPLMDELGRLTIAREKPLLILLEYHTGEESKAGFPDFDALLRGAEKALSFPGIRLGGLMTIAPFTDNTGLVRSSFRSLAKARDELRKRFSEAAWPCLSMGMSGDFEIAIEEGSSLVRIGSALFGERPL